MGSLDVSRFRDSVPRELREGFAESRDALSLHFEVTLLCHRGIPAAQKSLMQIPDRSRYHPHVVSGAQGGVDGDVTKCGEPVCGRIMGSHIDNRVDIGLWAT